MSLLLTFTLLLIRYGTCYKCLGSRCICLEPDGCKTNCTNGFCQNKEFVCTKTINHCSFNCQDIASCQDSTFYIASNEFYIHCSNSSSCNNVEILCGIPPHKPPSQLTNNDFNNTMQMCAIYAYTASITNSYISCNGDIEHCYIESQPTMTETVVDSQFDCSINTGKCNFNCSNCSRSIYSCDTPLESQCQYNGVIITTLSTTSTTNDTEYIGIDNIVFDLTDAKMSNLEVLYYIIMGAGCCLVCCICLCVLVICLIRSSVLRKENKKSNENPKSPHSEYRVYGQKQQSSDSNDRTIDVESTQSTDNNTHCSDEEPIDDDMTTNMDQELSIPPRNLKIKLTRPQSGHKKRNKRKKSQSKSKQSKASDDGDQNYNRLIPNNPNWSPMSPLSAISSSNPDPHEGTGVNNADNSMYTESIHSADSSELNLKSKPRTITETEAVPQSQQYLMTKQFEQMMANYANLSRGRSATQFAVMKQQLLYIQQHKQLHSVKNSHSHSTTTSNPTLPIIESDENNSDVITPSILEDTSTKDHIYTASTQSSATSSSSSDSECLDESSSDQSDDTCSCSDCVQNENEECTKTQCLGDNLNGSAGGSSSSSSCSSDCNDTQCSCQQCTVSCNTSSGSCSSAEDTNSTHSASSSESSSSSCTESDNDTEVTGVTITSILSEEELKKRLSKKWKKKYDMSSVDTDNIAINENMSTDNHSRQYTENSNLSLDLGTLGSTLSGDHAHSRFRTLVIHNVNSDQTNDSCYE